MWWIALAALAGLGLVTYEIGFKGRTLVPGRAYVLRVLRPGGMFGEAPEVVMGAVVALGVFRPLGQLPQHVSTPEQIGAGQVTEWSVPVLYDPFAGAISSAVGPRMDGEGRLSLPLTTAGGLGTDLTILSGEDVS